MQLTFAFNSNSSRWHARNSVGRALINRRKARRAQVDVSLALLAHYVGAPCVAARKTPKGCPTAVRNTPCMPKTSFLVVISAGLTPQASPAPARAAALSPAARLRGLTCAMIAPLSLHRNASHLPFLSIAAMHRPTRYSRRYPHTTCRCLQGGTSAQRKACRCRLPWARAPAGQPAAAALDRAPDDSCACDTARPASRHPPV